MTNTISSKQGDYSRLVENRKKCNLCTSHLTNASQIDDGSYDKDRIGPYSLWQGNLDAKLLVVAQDFSDIKSFLKNGGRAGSNVKTNRNLMQLLASADIAIAEPDNDSHDDVLFFTNAVLCMKSGSKGGMQQSIPAYCFKNCSTFLKKTIEIVAPKVVVTLGAGALRAVRLAFPGGSRKPLGEVVGLSFPLSDGIYLKPMYHPSPTVVNIRRSKEQMLKDWSNLRELLDGRS